MLIGQDDLFSVNHELKQNILRYTYRSSIRYMKGVAMPLWEAEYGVQKFTQEDTYDVKFQGFGFKFIDDLIVRNLIDKNNVNKILSDYLRIVEKKGHLKNDPYGLLRNWRLEDESTVNNWLESIINNISVKEGKNNYSTALYTGILFYIAELEVNHVSVDKCMSVVNAMKEYISMQESEFDDLESNVNYFSDGIVEKRFKELYKTINELLEEKKETIEKEMYESLIKNNYDWATLLLERTKERATISGHSFIYLLDPQELINRIENSNNKELFQFHCVLEQLCSTLYPKKKDDCFHLRELQNGLNMLIKHSIKLEKVKRANILLIVNDLSKYEKDVNKDSTDL